MKKGRPATRGLGDAVTIARTRGCTMRIMYGLESICDLVVRTATQVIFIRTRRIDRMTATIPEIECECRERISELRLFPKSAQILLELWVYNKYGTYRFFRLEEAGIAEIGRDGMPVPLPAPGIPAGPKGKKRPAKPAVTPAPAGLPEGGGGPVLPDEKVSPPANSPVPAVEEPSRDPAPTPS